MFLKTRISAYYIVTQSELKTQIQGNNYKPLNFDKDGFIHCTKEESVSLLVLEDYFVELSKQNVILILEIDVDKLTSEVKYEAPAPFEGAGATHLKDEIFFPHIYGSLNLDAVIGAVKQKELIINLSGLQNLAI